MTDTQQAKWCTLKIYTVTYKALIIYVTGEYIRHSEEVRSVGSI